MNIHQASCVPEEQPNNVPDLVRLFTLVAVYLVEPSWASSAVLKFSGTLGMPHCSDRQSVTIMAFSHLVLENTACRYMFTDIQGKSMFTCLSVAYINEESIDQQNFVPNKSALTLFDPMTHTPHR
jgi:hypothetical protein